MRLQQHVLQSRAMNRRWIGAVIVLGSLALVLKCLLAWNTLGTNDMSTWANFARVAAGLGPAHLYDGPVQEQYSYYRVSIFNHPPLMALSIRWLFSVAQSTGIPFRVLFRVIVSLADAGTLLFVCLAVRRGHLHASPLVICALAACPTSIMIAGFHGNSDPIMVFFLVASVYALECWGSVLLCGLLLGLAFEIKVVPVLLIPALLLYLPTWRNRVVCMTGFLFTAIPPFIPFVESIGKVLKNLFGYDSISGHWGSTYLWAVLHFHKFVWFEKLEKGFTIAVILAASAMMNAQRRRVPLHIQWGVLLFLFMFLTPGFGIQYLVWLVPWVAAVGVIPALTHYALSGSFVFLVYTYWSRGLPWYFANSYVMGDWHGWMHIFQLLAWLSALPVLWSYWRMLVSGAATGTKRD